MRTESPISTLGGRRSARPALTLTLALLLASGCADSAPDAADGGVASLDDRGARGHGDTQRDTSHDPGTGDVAADPGDAELDETVLSDADADDGRAPDGPLVVDLPERSDLDESCLETTAAAEPIRQPVDIIIFIDTSSSMEQEAERVEENMDELARFIAASGIDYRIILLTNDDVCVPAPPSGGGCPDTDSATYLHVRTGVASGEGFSELVDHYADYQAFLRPGAQVHIIGVTDDDDDESASWLQTQLGGLVDPGFPGGFTFHAIVAQGSIVVIGCCGLTGCGAAIGTEYLTLASRTGGVSASMCTDDWAGVFSAIATSVVERVGFPCTYAIPDPGPGLSVDPERINVAFNLAGGGRTLVRNVASAEACGSRPAWYFDDPVAPTEVRLCPAMCALEEGSVDIQFGCETIKE